MGWQLAGGAQEADPGRIEYSLEEEVFGKVQAKREKNPIRMMQGHWEGLAR